VRALCKAGRVLIRVLTTDVPAVDIDRPVSELVLGCKRAPAPLRLGLLWRTIREPVRYSSTAVQLGLIRAAVDHHGRLRVAPRRVQGAKPPLRPST
jgi:hypothetical protein